MDLSDKKHHFSNWSKKRQWHVYLWGGGGVNVDGFFTLPSISQNKIDTDIPSRVKTLYHCINNPI